jgi:hypothetical protein
MTFYQLTPTIPLRSPKASGEAVAVIDMSLEHDLMWVIIDDTTGQVWTVPNKDVRAFNNYSAGRNLKTSMEEVERSYRNSKPEAPAYDAAATIDAFAAQWIAQPGATQRLLSACLTEEHVRNVLVMLALPEGGLRENTPDWMPDFMGEAKP